MIYLDTDDAKPASTAGLWNTDLATTQAALKDIFLGVALEASASGDTDDITFRYEGIHEMDADSDSYEIGALVGAAKDTGNNLLAQKVDDAVAAGAIGVVHKAAPASSTRVLVRIFSQVMSGIKIGE